MHKLLVYVAYGSLTFAGAMHFVIDVASQYLREKRPAGPETTLFYGLNTAYALGQIVFGVLALVVATRAIERGGQYEGQQETFRDLGTVMGFGLVAVLLVLLAQFRRARLALLALASVPLALVGAMVILWLTQIPLNASSLMGCVLLAGLVVKNGILLPEHYESLRDAGFLDGN